MIPDSNLLDKARARFEMVRLSRGKIQDVKVDTIPQERESFLGSEDDWQIVNLPEDVNSTSCIYHGKKGNKFPPHKHEEATEQLMILNEGGKLKIITNECVRVLEYPDSIFFDKDEPHYIEWLEDTSVICIWHPAFKSGWEAHM